MHLGLALAALAASPVCDAKARAALADRLSERHLVLDDLSHDGQAAIAAADAALAAHRHPCAELEVASAAVEAVRINKEFAQAKFNRLARAAAGRRADTRITKLLMETSEAFVDGRYDRANAKLTETVAGLAQLPLPPPVQLCDVTEWRATLALRLSERQLLVADLAEKTQAAIADAELSYLRPCPELDAIGEATAHVRIDKPFIIAKLQRLASSEQSDDPRAAKLLQEVSEATAEGSYDRANAGLTQIFALQPASRGSNNNPTDSTAIP